MYVTSGNHTEQILTLEALVLVANALIDHRDAHESDGAAPVAGQATSQQLDLRAVLDELRFDLKHAKEVSRCAVIGDRAWERWATTVARPVFRKADVAFFESKELERAATWIREGLSLPPAAP